MRQALLTDTNGIRPNTFITGDKSVINSLARLAGMDPMRLNGMNVEYLRSQGRDIFDIVINGYHLTVRPAQQSGRRTNQIRAASSTR